MMAPNASAAGPKAEEPLQWHVSYRKAMELAENQKKMLFIYFYDTSDASLQRQLVFERQVLANPEIRRLLPTFVLLLQPTDAVISSEGKRVELLKDESFYHMYGTAGIAIVDVAHRDQPFFRHVVSAFPFDDDHFYGISRLKTILSLPPGSLTQRTLTYAVRMHPEGPGSADGKVDTSLISYAEDHSQLMANIQVQGHHNWEQRFHELATRIPNGLEPTEVAAESWPGQSLVDAAEECVHSWRQSDGHWDSVRRRHPIFGFDMKCGRNGIWYATGIFGRRR
jgi:hypothetical protein